MIIRGSATVVCLRQQPHAHAHAHVHANFIPPTRNRCHIWQHSQTASVTLSTLNFFLKQIIKLLLLYFWVVYTLNYVINHNSPEESEPHVTHTHTHTHTYIYISALMLFQSFPTIIYILWYTHTHTHTHTHTLMLFQSFPTIRYILWYTHTHTYVYTVG
jgi:hypothetical protein